MILYALRYKPSGQFRHKRGFTYKRPKPPELSDTPDLWKNRPPLSWGLYSVHGSKESDWEVVAFECNMIGSGTCIGIKGTPMEVAIND